MVCTGQHGEPRNLKHFAVCFISVVYATFMVFCQQNRPQKLSLQLKILSTLGCLAEDKHLWSETALVFSSSPPEIQVCVEPRSLL